MPIIACFRDQKELLEPYGPVTEVRIIEGCGFGFVDVPAENMDEAINTINDKDVNGRTLIVNEAPLKAAGANAGRQTKIVEEERC